jgi:hypothetical protein
LLEAYKPRPNASGVVFVCRWLAGCFELTLKRKTGILRLKALYLEPGLELDDKLVADVAVARRDFVAFHGAQDLVVESSEPDVFGAKLLAAL